MVTGSPLLRIRLHTSQGKPQAGSQFRQPYPSTELVWPRATLELWGLRSDQGNPTPLSQYCLSSSSPSCFPSASSHCLTAVLAQATVTIPRSGRLKWQKFIFSVLGARSPRSRCCQGWFLVRPPSLACRRPPSRRVLTWLFLCVCRERAHTLVSLSLLKSARIPSD